MTVLVDASAIVAMITNEPEADALADRLEQESDRLYCSIGAWEAARALARKRRTTTALALAEVMNFAWESGLRLVSVGREEAAEATLAHDRYGKGNHTARLNMGDCFAYACAKTNDARLLYKGNDFALTDLA